MGFKAWNLAIVLAIGAIWLAGTTQREKPVVSDRHQTKVAALEGEVANHDPAKVTELAQAYLDAAQPGMAIAVIQSQPPQVQVDPIVDHLYARALIDEGRSSEALEAERRVLSKCTESGEPHCSTWLIASATRRSDILEELVQHGVEDPEAHPEAARFASRHARYVTLAAH